MMINHSSPKEKWTIMMYMKDFDLMTTYAYALRSSNELTNENIDEILAQMERDGVYHPRNGGSIFTGQFKSIQIAWYMFGYYEKDLPRGSRTTKKMVFSPLGNLLLDNIRDKQKTALIFMTMLMGNAFHQPFSMMDASINIYPYRLIFQLLRDERLGGRLYDDEVFYLVMFMKTINQESYEELIKAILELRKAPPKEKYDNLFKANEAVCGLACHEWRYGAGMLRSAGIIDIHEGYEVGKLTYGNINPRTGKPNAVRSYRENYITLKPEMISLCDRLLDAYPYYECPYPEDDDRLPTDIIVEMYSFYPKELLEELGIESAEENAISNMLSIANNVTYYSREETENGDKFEYALTDALNLFYDVEAERMGGAGKPDIVCIHTPIYEGKLRFDIEAKATKTKVLEINSRRLRKHRALFNSRYTIIVAPNYARGVLDDIAGEASVVIKAATFANYLYQYIVKNGRDLSYAVLHDFAEQNLGKDITSLVNEYVYSNFGHGASDLRIRTKTI